MDCVKCGHAVLTKALVDKAAGVFDVYGADAWYERPLEEFVPVGMACTECGGTEFERESNILDVWFDSGSSHEAVLPFRTDHQWPADIYLEGSDQHRGWFHSSLLVGIGTRGRAPFNQVLTHGFVMDDQGRKMSKSLGNTVAPQDIIKQSGAEILRLWASMVDYREDIKVGKEVLARTVEAYRKIRNVIRVLVANLYDFDPKDDVVPKARMLEVDRWALAKYADAAERIVKAYDHYDYPGIFQAVSQLITVDLSAFYIDVTKDRMYTFGPKSEARCSGQTAMYIIVDGLARLLAPILSVTMDELWPRCTWRCSRRDWTSGRMRRSSSAGPRSPQCATRSTCSLKRSARTRRLPPTCRPRSSWQPAAMPRWHCTTTPTSCRPYSACRRSRLARRLWRRAFRPAWRSRSNAPPAPSASVAGATWPR